MSVIMTFRVAGDPDELERRAAQDPDAMRSISDRAKEHGLIPHRFYGADGQILGVDEWPDAESFQRFFEQLRREIDPVMREVGAPGAAEIAFWRKPEAHDEVVRAASARRFWRL